MRFYYFSLIGTFLALAASGVLVAAFWLVWTKLLGRKLTGRVVSVSIPVALLIPWSEEFWIAWNFGQLCRKDAGLFVAKTVEVEGFYDSTTAWGPRQLAERGYRFVESRDNIYGKLTRVERADAHARDRALQWYLDNNPGKERPKGLYIQHRVSDSEHIDVSPNGVDAWRTTKIDKPTAQYRFTIGGGTRAGHKVVRQESLIVSDRSSEVLARYAQYGRDAPWNFVGLGNAGYGCDGPDGGPNTKRSFLIYREVLIPVR